MKSRRHAAFILIHNFCALQMMLSSPANEFPPRQTISTVIQPIHLQRCLQAAQIMKKGFLYLLIALVLISGGTSVYYFYGYKDVSWIKGIAYILVVFGWVFILFDMLLIYPAALQLTSQGGGATGTSVLQKMKRVLFFSCFAVWMLALIANLFIVDEWMESRVSDILSTRATTPVKAVVTKIEDRSGRVSSHFFAIIRYKTPEGEMTQALADDNRLYKPDDRVQIRYSIQYPDMCSVVSDM